MVKLPDDLPHEVAAAFACGVNTGAGAVLNVLKPAPGSSIAVFGAGSVGLAAVPPRALPVVPRSVPSICTSRLALAREVGATQVAREKPERSFDFTLEAAGSAQALRAAVARSRRSACAAWSAARARHEARLEDGCCAGARCAAASRATRRPRRSFRSSSLIGARAVYQSRSSSATTSFPTSTARSLIR